MANKPFEEAVYDEVYSVADLSEEDTEESIIIPEIEIAEEVKEEEVTPVLSLREEITIPEISPIYKSDIPQKKKKAVSFAQLPEIKKKKTGDMSQIKRMVIIAAVAIALILLLIVSVAMKISDGNAESTTLIINNIFLFAENYGGVLLNGC